MEILISTISVLLVLFIFHHGMMKKRNEVDAQTLAWRSTIEQHLIIMRVWFQVIADKQGIELPNGDAIEMFRKGNAK
jgi:hypothetical protein